VILTASATGLSAPGKGPTAVVLGEFDVGVASSVTVDL
jgi:hypothetical protein